MNFWRWECIKAEFIYPERPFKPRGFALLQLENPITPRMERRLHLNHRRRSVLIFNHWSGRPRRSGHILQRVNGNMNECCAQSSTRVSEPADLAWAGHRCTMWETLGWRSWVKLESQRAQTEGKKSLAAVLLNRVEAWLDMTVAGCRPDMGVTFLLISGADEIITSY